MPLPMHCGAPRTSRPGFASPQMRLTPPRAQHLLLNALLAATATAAGAQSTWDGGVTHIDTVTAPSLRGNLIGDPDWREVTIYLPPGYRQNRQKRYPVIYLLHGFAADHRAFMRGAYQNLNIRISMDSLIRAGTVKDMIVVTPSARNFFDGSFYANSPVTGRWEDFIARDLVSHIDRRYRTSRGRQGRGIAGHSMGGFGALRVAMRNPDVFSAVYALSPCCLGRMDAPYLAAGWKAAARVTDRAAYPGSGFFANLLYALAALYSPNASRPPLFADLPYRVDGDSLVAVSSVAEKWMATPLAVARSHLPALRRLAIAFDAGVFDPLTDIPLNVRALDSLMTAHGIRHGAELYQGTHGGRFRLQLEEKALPFLSRNLR